MQNEPVLDGNEKLEQAIADVQAAPSQETLAAALTVLRRRMRAGGHLIPAVGADMRLGTVKTPDGRAWLCAFTSREQQMKGGEQVLSAFTAEIEPMLRAALTEKEAAGLILNPWERTLMLDKTLLRIVLGEEE